MNTAKRINAWYGLIVIILAVFLMRLFYLQVIKHGYYANAAQSNQLKQYVIPAERGAIYAHSSGGELPLVLNEVRYTVYADPKFIEDAAGTAQRIEELIGGKAKDYQEKMEVADSRYQILARQITKEKSDEILAKELKGIGTQPANYRTYPQGGLAAQVIGFVNQDGVGTTGVEQALDEMLKGKDGLLKAITDANGVPLAANEENTITEAEHGKDLVLTLDLSMQSQLEEVLKSGLNRAMSKSGNAIIMDVNTGAVKAMANYPTYKPAEYFKVKDASIFNNGAVSAPLEIGSVMKPLTAAAAINENKVSPNTTYYDPAMYEVDGYKITNIEEDGGAATRSVSDILQFSLNTGATWLLMQLGGGTLNETGRKLWYDYMTNRYQFGKPTGIEQGYEEAGRIPSPTEGFGLNLQYANTSFGQGMTATPIQVAGALASILNGGTYHKPYLVEATINEAGERQQTEPKVIKENVISESVSKQMVDLMKNVVDKNYVTYSMNRPPSQYTVGGKTGTAEVARPEGGYYEDRFNGTFIGFVGGNKAQYVIVVRVDEPKIPGYAGSKAAAPIFGQIVDMLINNFNVTPKS